MRLKSTIEAAKSEIVPAQQDITERASLGLSTQRFRMEAPPHKKQRQKPQKPQRKEDADGDDAPEPVQTVTKEMLQETTYEVKDGE